MSAAAGSAAAGGDQAWPAAAVTAPAGTRPLELALRYALGAAAAAAPELMPCPTPCRGWDLRTLLLHAGESLAALAEGFNDGRVGLLAAADCPGAEGDPALPFRERGRDLLTRCVSAAGDGAGVIAVAGCPMAMSTLIVAGAIEIAVHGWDISRACGRRLPIPEPLAADLLRVAPVLIGPADRGFLFAPPVSVAASASASDRLAAFLGRQPGP